MNDATSSVETFESGAIRDIHVGKTRIDLISPFFLEDLGMVMAKGAVKYSERNWEKGIDEQRLLASTMRHLNAIQTGKTPDGDDHICQAAFGLMAMCHTRHMVKKGLLPASLCNLPNYTPKETSDNGQTQDDSNDQSSERSHYLAAGGAGGPSAELTPADIGSAIAREVSGVRRFLTDHAH